MELFKPVENVSKVGIRKRMFVKFASAIEEGLLVILLKKIN